MAHQIIWLPDGVFETLKQYAGMAQFENRIEIGKYVLISEKHNDDVLIKRYEATKIVNQVFGLVDTGQAAKWVRVFEQLGMLKLEPDPVISTLDIRVIEAVKKSGYSGSIVLMELDRAGLKVVEK